MFPKLIKIAQEHKLALARIDQLMLAEAGTPEGDELELLAVLVELYEKARFPVGKPGPLAAIRFRMEQAGLKQKDLAPYIGGTGKVSEVLSGKRTLSIRMVRNLHRHLGIPAEVLLQSDTRSAVATKIRRRRLRLSARTGAPALGRTLSRHLQPRHK